MDKLKNNDKLFYYIKYLLPMRDGMIKFADFSSLTESELDVILEMCEINNYLQNFQEDEDS